MSNINNDDNHTTTNNNTKSIILLENEIILKVPLAIGTLQWGTTWIDEKIINNHGGCISDLTASEILRIVSDAGVTLIDTAEGYGGGTSEKRLARIITQQRQKQQTDSTTNCTDDDIIFMTKFLPAPWRGLFVSDMEYAVRGSCQRLNVSCIPIYLLHSPVHWLRSIEYWIYCLSVCYTKGLIKSIGLSNCNAQLVERAAIAAKLYNVPLVCNQVHYSLLDYNSKKLQDMQIVCNQYNIKIIGFSPIGQGILTEKLTPENWKTNKTKRIMKLQWDEIQTLHKTIQQIATKYNKSMTQICLNWSIQHNIIPLIGCRTKQQANDIIGCLHWNLLPEDVQLLDNVALNKSTFDSPSWRRMIFVSLFGIVMVVCRTLDRLGIGNKYYIKEAEKEELQDEKKKK